MSFFRHAFSWARLRANSCARHLRGFSFTVPPGMHWFPPIKQPLALGAAASRFWVPQENEAEKGEKIMSYLNSVTIIGFVGADPEQRQARNNNGSKFTVLSVATQRSWKNAQDEWSSKTEWHRVCIFRPRLAEYVATAIKKGSHVLVEGSLISTAYERGVGKGKKAKTTKQTFWCIRADVVRKLDRGEPDPETVVSGSNASDQIAQTSDGDSF